TVNERSVLSVTELWFLDENPGFPQTSSPESAQIRINPEGAAIVTIFAPHWSNSPETMATQLTAEYLGIHPDRIIVTYAPTEHGLISKGPVGSRYTVMLAGAIAGAARQLREKILAIAAHMLEVTPDELVPGDEAVRVAEDPSRMLTYGEISRAAHSFRLSLPDGDAFRSGMSAQYTYDHPYTTMPKPDKSDLGVFYPIVGHACHIAMVEIDERT